MGDEDRCRPGDAPRRPARRRSDAARDPASDAGARSRRLAELVAELTGCGASEALAAVQAALRGRRRREDLAVVAEAVADLQRPLPEGMRLAGYLRPDATEPPAPADGSTTGP